MNEESRNGEGSFEQLLNSSSGTQGKVPIGEKVQAKIFEIGKEYLFLDLGGREEGMLPRSEVEKEGELELSVGDTISVFTVQMRDGAVLCASRLGAAGSVDRPGDREAALVALRDAYESRMPVEGTVKEVVKAGFSVTVLGLRAFCPISQISDTYCETPEEYLGQTHSFLVIEFDGTGRNLVLSRRRLLEMESEDLARETMEKLEVGAVFDGVVKTVKSYGVFVDIGGVEGLLHVSEIDHDRVDDPADVFTAGQSVRVQVKDIDRERKRISLSRKSLLGDPWVGIESEFPEGSVVTGRVIRIAQFGAFVELKKGVEGLVHISKMGGGRRLKTPREAVQEGEEVQVRVLGIDLDRARISLSIDDAVEGEEEFDRAALEEHRRAERSQGDSKAQQNRGLGTFGDLFADKLKR